MRTSFGVGDTGGRASCVTPAAGSVCSQGQYTIANPCQYSEKSNFTFNETQHFYIYVVQMAYAMPTYFIMDYRIL